MYKRQDEGHDHNVTHNHDFPVFHEAKFVRELPAQEADPRSGIVARPKLVEVDVEYWDKVSGYVFLSYNTIRSIQEHWILPAVFFDTHSTHNEVVGPLTTVPGSSPAKRCMRVRFEPSSGAQYMLRISTGSYTYHTAPYYLPVEAPAE